MGFQPDVGATVVVAKLTDLGTKYLLTDPERFEIKKFAAYDDEIDYALWNETHPDGTNFFGIAIESLHLLEPIKSSTWQLQYPLVRDFPRDVIRMPYIVTENETETITTIDDVAQISGRVLNMSVSTLMVQVSDTNYADVKGGSRPLNDFRAAPNLIPSAGFRTAGMAQVSVTGDTFNITVVPKITTVDKVVEFKIIEPQSGISRSVAVTVSANNKLIINTPDTV